ncbi:MAG TPA: ABC transporter substrate-binding protein [Candidatus Binataceae bacterium]|nr:ABC transporter substrate-binding protein [Candidatus Binataceae bacterium]
MAFKTRLVLVVLVLVAAVAWIGAAGASLPDAMPEVRSLGDRVLSIAKDPACKANREGCRQRLRTLIEGYWDTHDMAKSALGYHWKTLDNQQREQFTKLFSNLVESIYLSRSNFSKAQNYTNSVKIDYQKEIPEGDGFCKINTTVTLKQGDKPIRVDYRLRWVEGRWKVYDIIVEDISLTGNYRNQFNRVINNQGYPELVRLLQNKIQQINASEGT